MFKKLFFVLVIGMVLVSGSVFGQSVEHGFGEMGPEETAEQLVQEARISMHALLDESGKLEDVYERYGIFQRGLKGIIERVCKPEIPGTDKSVLTSFLKEIVAFDQRHSDVMDMAVLNIVRGILFDVMKKDMGEKMTLIRKLQARGIPVVVLTDSGIVVSDSPGSISLPLDLGRKPENTGKLEQTAADKVKNLSPEAFAELSRETGILGQLGETPALGMEGDDLNKKIKHDQVIGKDSIEKAAETEKDIKPRNGRIGKDIS